MLPFVLCFAVCGSNRSNPPADEPWYALTVLVTQRPACMRSMQITISPFGLLLKFCRSGLTNLDPAVIREFVDDVHRQHRRHSVLPTPLLGDDKYNATPYIDPKPLAARRYRKESQLHRSASITTQNRGEFRSQHDLGQDQDAPNEDELPPIQKLFRPIFWSFLPIVGNPVR